MTPFSRNPALSVVFFHLRPALLWGAATLALVAANASARPEEKSDSTSIVSLSGRVARAPVREGEPVRFWVTIENRTNSPLQHIRLERIDPEEFATVGGTMSVPSGNICQTPIPKSAKGTAPSAAPKDEKEICEYLGPHQSFTVWGRVQADAPVTRQNAFAAIQWQSQDGPSLGAVPLGEVESLSCLRWTWYSLLHEWELGVPTFAALLGLVFATWKWLRERREKKARDLEDKRSNTWNLMLRESHRAALKYYMPIATALRSAIDEMERFQSCGSTNVGIAQSGFFYLLTFHWETVRTKRELGAYYFKNRLAETLVYQLFQRHRLLVGLKEPAKQRMLDQCLDKISAKTTSDIVAGMIAANVLPISQLWSHFYSWLVRPESRARAEDLVVLEAYYELLVYEANRPYEHWYGDSEPLKFSEQARAAVRKVGRYIKRDKETKDYLETAAAKRGAGDF